VSWPARGAALSHGALTRFRLTRPCRGLTPERPAISSRPRAPSATGRQTTSPARSSPRPSAAPEYIRTTQTCCGDSEIHAAGKRRLRPATASKSSPPRGDYPSLTLPPHPSGQPQQNRSPNGSQEVQARDKAFDGSAGRTRRAPKYGRITPSVVPRTATFTRLTWSRY